VSPLLLWKSFLSATVSCALYAVALSYYHYLNFLGYSALPFLERTEVGVVVNTMMAVRMWLWQHVWQEVHCIVCEGTHVNLSV
jgi:hypothetical protein